MKQDNRSMTEMEMSDMNTQAEADYHATMALRATMTKDQIELADKQIARTMAVLSREQINHDNPPCSYCRRGEHDKCNNELHVFLKYSGKG